MESLIEWSGYKVHPDYKDILNNLVKQLKDLRQKYNDKTGQPVRFWPTGTYD